MRRIAAALFVALLALLASASGAQADVVAWRETTGGCYYNYKAVGTSLYAFNHHNTILIQFRLEYAQSIHPDGSVWVKPGYSHSVTGRNYDFMINYQPTSVHATMPAPDANMREIWWGTAFGNYAAKAVRQSFNSYLYFIPRAATARYYTIHSNGIIVDASNGGTSDWWSVTGYYVPLFQTWIRSGTADARFMFAVTDEHILSPADVAFTGGTVGNGHVAADNYCYVQL